MNYQLTSDSILIEGREPIDRKVFEMWLWRYTDLRPNELKMFWESKLEWCQPDEILQDYIDMTESFTTFDEIKKGIDRICK